jgi:uncharacterized membrane protein YbhN (UPF0104 family)
MTRNLLLFVLRLLLTAGLMLLAIRSMPEGIDWNLLVDVGMPALAVSISLGVLLVPVLGWRWHRLLSAKRSDGQQYRPSLLTCSLLIWLGLAVNQVLPSILGGDAARAGFLARAGTPLSEAVISVAADRIIGLIGLLLVCTATSPFVLAGSFLPSLLLMLGVLAGAGFVGAVLYRFGSRMPKLAAALDLLGRISPSELLLLMAAAIAGHLLNFTIFLVVASALGLDSPVLATIALLAIIGAAAALPVSIAGWGIREVTLINGLAVLSLPADRVFAASVIYGGIMFIVQAPGFLVLLKKPA